jgi:subtilisin family serine protease
LSTWPLGPLGGYAILSGTSMATPYIAASYALVKSAFPTATIEQIKDRLQANANPIPWIYNKTQIASTAQQGAGLVNVYNAIFSQSTTSPGQLLVSDVSKTVYGAVNITISFTINSPASGVNPSNLPVFGGFIKVTYPYQPSAFAPNSTVFGYKGFGTLLNVTGWS